MIVDRLFEAERRWPDKAAVIRGDSVLSYRDLADRVRRSARALRAHGVKRGDRVVREATSTPEFTMAYLATHQSGAIAVPVSPRAPAGFLPQVLATTSPAAVIGHQSEGWGPLTYESIARQVDASDHEEPDSPGKADPADLLFTTGTTGRAKGVVLSHAAIETAAAYISEFLRQGEEDVEVVPLPLHHSFGLGRLRCCIYRGSTLVLVDGPTVFADSMRAMRKFHATGFASVPSGFAILFRSLGDVLGEFSGQLRYLEIGSAPMPLADKKRLMKLLPNTRICMHYGLTEASRSAFIEFHESRDALDSIGRPSPGVRIEVLDADGTPVAAGEEGRIAIQSGAVMNGYWQDEEATRKAFSGDFLLTGDLGRRDETGLLYLAGRESEFINIGGEKVAPGEVESLLMQHPEVADCACIGIPDPSGISGEVVKAILVAHPHNSARPSNQALAKHLRRRIQPYKMPRVFEWVDAIPRSESGKVLRNALR